MASACYTYVRSMLIKPDAHVKNFLRSTSNLLYLINQNTRQQIIPQSFLKRRSDFSKLYNPPECIALCCASYNPLPAVKQHTVHNDFVTLFFVLDSTFNIKMQIRLLLSVPRGERGLRRARSNLQQIRCKRKVMQLSFHALLLTCKQRWSTGAGS